MSSDFLWEHGKAPDIVVEIVSNKKGGELDRKWKEYCRIGVPHYVVYDPACQIQNGELAYYQLQGGVYQKNEPIAFSGLNLQLCIWPGSFEGTGDRWLRWADGDGNVLLTGAELAEEERQRADHEAQRANDEARRADREAQRAEALAGKLRAMGIDPDADLG
ncbi:MAG: Uma2 family endonuclease [Verrucomicrobia bacterium]|nr:Uma2 family endonuclease [Verrucomicrobiota bacterium]